MQIMQHAEEKPMNPSRRNILAMLGLAPVSLLAASAAKAADAACYDPAALPLSERNRRRAIGYVEASTDPKKRCGGCAFFTAGKGDCGTCQLLSGGRVTSAGICNSFAPKPA
jgi:hypothetical protein